MQYSCEITPRSCTKHDDSNVSRDRKPYYNALREFLKTLKREEILCERLSDLEDLVGPEEERVAFLRQYY